MFSTRELAIQIHNEARKFAQGSMMKSVVAYGGTSVFYQASQLQRGCNILVATPGRCDHCYLDLYRQVSIVLWISNPAYLFAVGGYVCLFSLFPLKAAGLCGEGSSLSEQLQVLGPRRSRQDVGHGLHAGDTEDGGGS